LGFCIRLIKSISATDFRYTNTLSGIASADTNTLCFKADLAGQKVTELKTEEGRFHLFGDLIEAPDFKWENAREWSQAALGNFNAIYTGPEGLMILPSLFNLIPVFYYETAQDFWISDRIETLVEAAQIPVNPSKENILERLFFNYSITNRTLIDKIRLFPVNAHFICKDGDIGFSKHTEIFGLYTDQPKSLKHSRKELVSLFSKQIAKYLPNEKYASAFTGGFDGRCVVASGLKNQSSFESFSFGTAEASDVIIPLQAAKEGGFEYRCINLDQAYLESDFKQQAEGMIMDSNGMSTLSRAHYRYGARDLAKKYSYLLSGNFGSELFRAAHLDGVMTSNAFYHWMKDDLPSSLNELFEIFPKLKVMNHDTYEEAYQNLKRDLDQRKEGIPKIPLNAQLYCFMWEETIRNYFGPEIAMQQKYIAHRSPFLDYKFFSFLQGTQFSGAYGNFRERNLAKRMKGQMFYAYYLKETHKELFRAITGKGYRPSDLINLFGLGKIISGKLIKKKSEGDGDPLLVTKGFRVNRKSWSDEMGDLLLSFDLNLRGDERTQQTLLSVAIFFKNMRRNGSEN
jgi:hypothetical protein